MIEDKLKELGLSDKEAAVYTAVVEAGKASPARVAKATGIKRPTVYAVGNDLLQKGLLEADNAGPTTFYFPASGEALKRSIEKEKQKLKTKENLLESLAKEVEALPRSKTYAVPKIQFIEHEENVLDFLHKQMPLWNDSMLKSGPSYWGFQDHTFVANEKYVQWIKWAWDHTDERIDLNLLSNDTDAEKQMQQEKFPRRHIKFWSGAINFTATQWIMGDYSVLIQTAQKPHYLVQLYDPVYCANMRELFKNLWKEI